MFDNILSWPDIFLATAGNDPFAAMWFLFTHGGWIFVAYIFIWGFLEIYLDGKQGAFIAKKEWILLAIDIPHSSEQTPRAVENLFAHLAGAHGSISWTEKWFLGKTQDQIAVEIVSIDGHVQFLMRTTRGFRDLIEGSIYAQYPGAEITEVEDYTLKVPQYYPDREWDVFGMELIPVKPDVYPLRTYSEFEDKMTGEFKDPTATLLESMSRLLPGEQAWYQIVLTPIDQKDFRARGEAIVKKLKGEVVPAKVGTIEKVILFPFTLLRWFAEGAGIMTAPVPPKKEADPFGKVMKLTPGERNVLESVENKIAKIAFACKIRFVYVGKKEVMKKSRIAHPFIGAIKQFNTNDMQSLKPDFKKTGMSSTLLVMKDRRNNERKRKLMRAYRSRSNWAGMPSFCMNIEELATLWHFPMTMNIKIPQVKATEVKRAPPPSNIPFG